MAEFVNDCPRCGAKKITFDIAGDVVLGTIDTLTYVFETLCLCRACERSTIFVMHAKVENSSHSWNSGGLSQARGSLYHGIDIMGHVSVASEATILPPEFIPADVEACFKEGTACLAIQCFNAAGAMFRLVLDLATKKLLPAEGADNGPNRKQRNRIFDRLAYLFEAGILPRGLEELAACVREDGNDAAHDGTLAKADAEDLLDFSRLLLERIYTEPARLQQARDRRDQRRA
jgi:hypothetical protein